MNTQIILEKIKQYPVAVGAVVLVILLVSAWYFRKGGIPEMQAEQDSLSSQVEVMERNQDRATGLEADLATLKELTAALESRLMRRAEKTQNVAYFYSFEEEGALEIETVNQMPLGQLTRDQERERRNQMYESIEFTLQVEGSYEQLVRFTHDLRNGEKILRVEDIGITPVNEGLGQDLLRATISVNALAEKPNEETTGRS